VGHGDQLRPLRHCGPRLGERGDPDRRARPARKRGERREQPRVLLVGGEHLVAGPELQRRQHQVHRVGRRPGERDLVGRRAHQRRDPSAEAFGEVFEPIPVDRAAAASAQLVLEAGTGRRRGARRHGAVGAGVQVGTLGQHRELGSEGVVVQAHDRIRAGETRTGRAGGAARCGGWGERWGWA
jgi:hypothetical protein